MFLADQNWEFIRITCDSENLVEFAGRTCYNSKDRIGEGTATPFIEKIIKKGHESVIEHAVVTLLIKTNRSVTHELIRHRIASYSQQSTRYVNLNGKMVFIRPVWMPDLPTGRYEYSPIHDGLIFLDGKQSDLKSVTGITFIKNCLDAEINYNRLLNFGWKPEQAREVLTNALSTEIIMTANFREFRTIFRQRASNKAHPQIRSLFSNMLFVFKNEFPVFFKDINLQSED